MHPIPRWLKAIPLVALLAATTLYAASPTTSATPGTLPNPAGPTRAGTPGKADFSTPAATASTLLTGINTSDFALVRQSLDIQPPHAAEVNALLETMEATAKLQQAALAKYAAAGANAFGTPTPAMLIQQLKVVAAAPVSITGDTATLNLPPTAEASISGGIVEFKKIGPDWKIDAAAFFKLATESAAKTADRITLTKKITAITLDVIRDINAGKFFSATDAYQGYWNRCKEASQPPAPATAPATKP